MNSDNEHCSGRPDRLGRLAYSVTEAAAVTGLGRTTLYALMRDRTLSSFTVGKRRLIAMEDLENMIAQARQAAA